MVTFPPTRPRAPTLKGPGATLVDVLQATEYVMPALEIIDARIEQFDRDTKAPRKVFDTIADFAANAGIVLGGRPVRPDAVDLRWVGALLYKNAVIEETGVAAGVTVTLLPAGVAANAKLRKAPEFYE